MGTFNVGGELVGTISITIGADVKGIGLGDYYPPEEYQRSLRKPPLTPAILLHSNVLKLQQRADLQGAPVDGFANYLFLLELSHRFGPPSACPRRARRPSSASISTGPSG